MQLILASASPRRKELLGKLSYPFEIIPAQGEERSDAASPTEMVCDLALHKASEVFANHSDCVVVGCDTVVDLNGCVLGKPMDRADAIGMLHRLSGNKHLVHTGVCVLYPGGRQLFCDTTEVYFRALTEQEILRYVDSGAAYGKAGAYGIQDDAHLVERYVGDFDNVVGLPVYRLAQILDSIFKGR